MTCHVIPWLLLGLLAAAPAQAEPIAVRSGEHDGFTRLAFSAPPGLTWTMSRSGDRSTTIAFAGADLSFTTDEVFARIGRSRIGAVRASGSALGLDLSCDCSVDVEGAVPGYVTIDVADAQPSRQSPHAALPLRLEPIALPSHRDWATSAAAAPALPPYDPVAQVRVRSAIAASPTDESDVARCAIEEMAAGLLRRSPEAALAMIPARRAAIADEAGEVDAKALTALAETYLIAGFGAEAERAFVAAGHAPETPLRRIASMMDGASAPTPNLDPHCGPASTLLVVLSGEIAFLDAHLEADMLAFFDRLPPERRRDMAPRLRPHLPGSERTLTILAGQSALEDEAPSGVVAGGTDLDAVRAAIASLDPGNGSTNDVPLPLRLQNALALRTSLPAGPMRTAMDEALVERLVGERFFRPAAKLAEADPALAGLAIQHAIASLPPEQALEGVVQFRDALDPADPRQADIEALLTQFGLGPDAALTESGGLAAPGLGPAERAWLMRDFGALDAMDETPRAAFASEIRRRNAALTPEGDFARARQAVDDADRLAAVLGRLTGAEDLP